MQNRRDVLKILSSAGVAVAFPWVGFLSGCKTARVSSSSSESPEVSAASKDFLGITSPVNRLALAPQKGTFTGDNPGRAHSILWNKDEYLRAKNFDPKRVTQSVPLVVVGGGVSGLLSAYLLRDQHPFVIEQAPRFGGNSKGENWDGLDYALGAAYFTAPEAGTELDLLLRELGLDKVWRIKTTDDPILYQGQVFENFWSGDSDPKNRAQFVKLQRYFHAVLNEDGYEYPEIPLEKPEGIKNVRELDRESFHAHLERIVGGPLHPHIETAVEHYCWSSFGASAKNTSAAMGLNFYAGEFGPVIVFPGGNATVAEAALKKLHASIPQDRLRTNSVVFDVRAVGDGALVSIENANGGIETVHAKAVIMACPKSVVKRTLHGIEPKRLEAVSKIQYTAYMVANVLLSKKVSKDFYDLFLLGDGRTNVKDVFESARKQRVTDSVLADFAQRSSQKSVLTLYRALPYDGGRGELLAPDAHERFRREFEEQLRGQILPTLGLTMADVVDIRLSRWGHPMPVAKPGMVRDGTVDAIRAPHKGRVFFVQQDNWLLPALETAAAEAFHWTKEVRRVLT